MMIDICQLHFEYKRHKVLQNIELSIAAGTVTALVGPNGAGKTTLMRCIAGLEMPCSGTVYVDSIDVLQNPRQAHRLMGYLADSFGLYLDLTVMQCLEYAATSRGLSARETRTAIERVIHQVGLANRLRQPGRELSRGLRQRLAIGQAIIHSPKVLLLDEPAAGLDPEARANLADLFRTLQAGGMTLLVSSHMLTELNDYSTHLVFLRDGQLIDKQTLTGNNATPNQKHIRLQLATADLRLKDWLHDQTGLSHILVRAESGQFVFNGDLCSQTALLRKLIADGFQVTDFGVIRDSLQQSYLSASANTPGNPQ